MTPKAALYYFRLFFRVRPCQRSRFDLHSDIHFWKKTTRVKNTCFGALRKCVPNNASSFQVLIRKIGRRVTISLGNFLLDRPSLYGTRKPQACVRLSPCGARPQSSCGDGNWRRGTCIIIDPDDCPATFSLPRVYHSSTTPLLV